MADHCCVFCQGHLALQTLAGKYTHSTRLIRPGKTAIMQRGWQLSPFRSYASRQACCQVLEAVRQATLDRSDLTRNPVEQGLVGLQSLANLGWQPANLWNTVAQTQHHPNPSLHWY